MFDERLHRPPGGPAVNLGRTLVELSHEYGLHVELETEGESAASSGAGENDGGCGTATAKPNLLSIVREKAQRLWNQRQSVFKGRADADEKEDAQTLAGMDVESGGPAIDGCGTAGPVRKSACSVSTIDETAVPVVAIQSARMGNRPMQYRTLEYNASAADVTAYASPDSAVQCCTVNSSEPPAAPVVVVQETTAAASVSLQTAAETAGMSDAAIDSDRKPEKPRMNKLIYGVDKPINSVDKLLNDTDKPRMDKLINGVDKPINGVDKPINDTDRPRTDEFINSVETQQICEPGTADGAEKPTIGGKPGNDDDQKKATSNQPPPPPPPRKYNAPVISPVPVTPTNHDPAGTTTVAVTASTVTAVAPAVLLFTVPDTVAPVTAVYSVPDTRSAAPGAQHEIRMNDDYYWCTTTAMVPPMSTFGKRANNDALDVSGKTRNENAITGSNTNVADVVVAVQHNDMDDNRVGSPDAVVGGTNSSIEDTVVGGTTSIEDASLPSFSSDDDDDDDNVEENDIGYNGVQYTEKNKLTAHSVDDDVSRPSDSNKIGENNNNGRRKNDGDKTTMKTVECNGAPPQNRTETNASSVAAETKLVTTKLPTLRLSLSSPPQSGVGCCTPSTLSSASSTSSTSSSPTNNNNSPVPPIVSKIPVRRQSAGSGGSTPTAVSSPITSNGTAKKSIPLPLSRSGSRLAMWTSAN